MKIHKQAGSIGLVILVVVGAHSCYGVEEGDMDACTSGCCLSNCDTDTNTDTTIDTDTTTDTDTSVAGPPIKWHTYYGHGHFEDRGYSVVADSVGNIYVTGRTASWDGPNGEKPLHQASYKYEIVILKLDRNGAYQWHTFYGSNGYDIAESLAVDGDQNIYITGYSDFSWNGPSGQRPLNPHTIDDDIIDTDSDTGTGTEYIPSEYDLFVLKLDANGEYQWHTFYGTNYNDKGNSITVDEEGNLYVIGTSEYGWDGPDGLGPLNPHSGGFEDAAESDAFTLKLDTNGAYQWHTFYGSSDYDDGHSLAVDGTGNIYTMGFSLNAWNGPSGQNPLHLHLDDDNHGAFVQKLDANGAYQWHTFYKGGGSSNQLSLDGAGNVYLANISDAWNGPNGESPLNPFSEGEMEPFDGNGYVLKLDGSGVYQWHTFINGWIYALALDQVGNIFVTGYFEEKNYEESLNGLKPEYDPELLVLKLDGNGARQWAALYAGSSAGLCTDGSGDLYVAGYSYGDSQSPTDPSPLNPFSGDDYGDLYIFKLATSEYQD
ncbi:MAG: SBBP repeat-containing protein [Myxococcota bacterium]|nr:SBBP repeat-containing protein [Myxococcota bacterium]